MFENFQQIFILKTIIIAYLHLFSVTLKHQYGDYQYYLDLANKYSGW